MRLSPSPWRRYLLALVVSVAAAVPVRAEVGLVDHQGNRLDFTELRFRDETGKDVALGSYFQPKRPVLLTLVYYGCPGMCTLTLNGLFDSLKRVKFVPGKAIEVVAVSIDPDETPELARKKKNSYLSRYGFEKDADGFHFLVGAQPAITKLADLLGFKYERSGDEFAHPGVVYALSPEGVITKSLPGTSFRSRAFREFIAAASTGRTISSFERMVYACTHWWQRGWTARLLSYLGF